MEGGVFCTVQDRVIEWAKRTKKEPNRGKPWVKKNRGLEGVREPVSVEREKSGKRSH